MEKYKHFLSSEHPGFMGKTHWLIAMCLFFIMWIIPWDFANEYIDAISSNKIFAFMVFLIIGGASLIPDLDSSPLQEGGSTAVYQLGFLGNALSVLVIVISGVVYAIFHTKSDAKPKSQHRMLFHAPLIPFIIFAYAIFFIPKTDQRLIDNIGMENANMCILVFLASISIYLGSSMLFYRLLKLFHRQRYTQWFCLFFLTLGIYSMLNMPYTQLRLIVEAIGFGYLFHIIADFFSKGSAPIFFPIPTKKNGNWVIWNKPYFLGISSLAITTGGMLNLVLDFIFAGLDILLFYIIFIK